MLNSWLLLKKEIEEMLPTAIEAAMLSRPGCYALLRKRFSSKGWQDQSLVFGDPNDPGANMDFLKGE